HPDKIADQISDAVLDAIIAKDPAARVACETLVTTGMAVVAGEITTSTYVHIPDIVRRSEEHTSELQSRVDLVCRLLLEKKTENIQQQAKEKHKRACLLRLVSGTRR